MIYTRDIKKRLFLRNYFQDMCNIQKQIKWIIRDCWCLNWVHLVIKMPNLENIEFYTSTLWDHNAKFLIMVYRRNSWVPNDCILVGINETKWTTFDNLEFQEASRVTIFRPPNSYILHCHGKCGLFTIYLKGNGIKNSEFGKSWILYMYTVGPQCKIFNYGLQEELMGAKWLQFDRNKWN